jgi:pimeloyl-ACP methyl ester carboxylesterase
MREDFDLHRVKIHGHEVGYRSTGSGPAVLLVHGMAGSSRTWGPLMARLRDRYTLIAPDLLGHGESAKPTGDYSIGAFASGLRDLLSVLGIERASIVGQSLGGGVAMQLCYQHPELCERMVLVGSGGLGREVSWVLRALALPGNEYVTPLAFHFFLRDRGDGLGVLLKRIGWHAPHAIEMWRAYTSLAEASSRAAFFRTLRAVIDSGGQAVSAHDRLYLTNGMPTLIVWGEQDSVIPVTHAHAAYRAMPGSRLEIFEGAGHFLHVEEPDRFARSLGEFIDSTEPRRPHDEPAASSYRDLLRGRLRAAG